MAAPAPFANIVVPAMPPQTAIMFEVFGFPAPGTAIPNPTMADYINAEDLLKHSSSLPAADQAAIKQFCGNVMLAVHPNMQAILAAAMAPLASQVAAMTAQLAAMAAQVAAMAAQQAAMAAQLAAMAAQQAAMAAQLAAMAAQQAAMTAQLTAIGAQPTAMADQVAAMPDVILVRQRASDIRHVHSIMGVNDILMKLPCERIPVGLPLNIEPPSVLCG